MCLFSRSVQRLRSTQIFARLEADRQFIVYEMNYSAAEDLAMILPVPTAASPDTDLVEFINLEDFPAFFSTLRRPFEKPRVPGAVAAARTLDVSQVGCFEASFVPTLKDFTRLDRRFRLPQRIWKALPIYRDFGFVVFKLRAARNEQVHPMAFSFKTRFNDRLFFPTVHIHGGEAHPTARFNHDHYCQIPADWNSPDEWKASVKSLGRFKLPGDVVAKKDRCYLRRLIGTLENADHYVVR